LYEPKKTGSTFLKKSDGLAKKKAPSFFQVFARNKKRIIFFSVFKTYLRVKFL